VNFVDLDGNEVSVSLAKFLIVKENKSSYHKAARQLLQEIFAPRKVLEEISLKVPDQLFLDFFVPECRVAVEVQGAQHTTYTPHFHKDKMAFYKAQYRDKRKQQFLSLNNITVVELPHYESREQWRARILGVFNGSGENGSSGQAS
jgi:hypothetical protein